MAAKSTQLYLVFQNKAHHYQNLQTMRAKVDDHLSGTLNQTINVIERQKYDRDMPVNKRYSIEHENKNMTDRLSNIYQKDRKVILNDGSYSRFNKFQRPFRSKNHYRSQEERQIALHNQKIKQKIESMRSGSTKYWQSEYKDQRKFTKNMINSEHRSSQASLHIDNKPFLAKPYLEFINNLPSERKSTILEDSVISKRSGRLKEGYNINQDKLFELPFFPAKQTRVEKSKVTLATLENHQNPEKKE